MSGVAGRLVFLSPGAHARFKLIDTQPKLLPGDLARQLLPGTFEHALNHLIDDELDLTGFEGRYQNNVTGAPDYPPGVLLKIVLAGYAHGVISSLGIERLCHENVPNRPSQCRG